MNDITPAAPPAPVIERDAAIAGVHGVVDAIYDRNPDAFTIRDGATATPTRDGWTAQTTLQLATKGGHAARYRITVTVEVL